MLGLVLLLLVVWLCLLRASVVCGGYVSCLVGCAGVVVGGWAVLRFGFLCFTVDAAFVFWVLTCLLMCLGFFCFPSEVSIILIWL